MNMKTFQSLSEAEQEFTFRKISYIIVKVSELDKVNFNEVEQTPDTVRTNNENTKAILTWKLSSTSLLRPTFLSKLSEFEGPFSNLEIQHILQNPEWNGGIDDGVEIDEENRSPPFHVND